MKIVTTGLYRSGTTWLYNAVRLVMQNGGLNPKGAFGIDYRALKGNIVIKTHHFYYFMAKDVDLIISTTRPIAKVKQSMERMKKLNLNEGYENAAKINELDEFYHQHELWLQHVDHVIHFHQIIKNPVKAVQGIAKLLNLEVDCNKIAEELKNMKAPNQGHDLITFMSEAHDKFIK